MELQTPLPLTPSPFPEPPREKPSSSAEFVPDSRSLPTLRTAAASCAGCELFRCATQTVFGEAPHALLMFVGEAADMAMSTVRPQGASRAASRTRTS